MLPIPFVRPMWWKSPPFIVAIHGTLIGWAWVGNAYCWIWMSCLCSIFCRQHGVFTRKMLVVSPGEIWKNWICLITKRVKTGCAIDLAIMLSPYLTPHPYRKSQMRTKPTRILHSFKFCKLQTDRKHEKKTMFPLLQDWVGMFLEALPKNGWGSTRPTPSHPPVNPWWRRLAHRMQGVIQGNRKPRPASIGASGIGLPTSSCPS